MDTKKTLAKSVDKMALAVYTLFIRGLGGVALSCNWQIIEITAGIVSSGRLFLFVQKQLHYMEQYHNDNVYDNQND